MIGAPWTPSANTDRRAEAFSAQPSKPSIAAASSSSVAAAAASAWAFSTGPLAAGCRAGALRWAGAGP